MTATTISAVLRKEMNSGPRAAWREELQRRTEWGKELDSKEMDKLLRELWELQKRVAK